MAAASTQPSSPQSKRPKRGHAGSDVPTSPVDTTPQSGSSTASNALLDEFGREKSLLTSPDSEPAPLPDLQLLPDIPDLETSSQLARGASSQVPPPTTDVVTTQTASGIQPTADVPEELTKILGKPAIVRAEHKQSREREQEDLRHADQFAELVHGLGHILV